ncbi:hypothetical protein E2C01_100962 [Portunus trituberculatus]|uniref:Uncharacterized protein n=1 Tax=Portunus trituberculatus TaxID=210409 RepID=A0A5B7K8B2_PORTR|nr:hypothetical protein [Portunus trituberculatus]
MDLWRERYVEVLELCRVRWRLEKVEVQQRREEKRRREEGNTQEAWTMMWR